MGRRNPKRAVLLSVLLVSLWPRTVLPQYNEKVNQGPSSEIGTDNPLFEDAYGSALNSLEFALRSTDETITTAFNPNAGALYRDEFVYKPPITSRTTVGSVADYTMNVIFDPCRGHPADCCSSKYGTPEYIQNIDTPQQFSVTADGEKVNPKFSRLETKMMTFDRSCLGTNSPISIATACGACVVGATVKNRQILTSLECELQHPELYQRRCVDGVNTAQRSRDIDWHLTVNADNYRVPNPFSSSAGDLYCFRVPGEVVSACFSVLRERKDCIDRGVKETQTRANPTCWDYNATVKSGLPCLTKENEKKPTCVQIAYMQNAFIVQCAGEEDPHCGTFFEVHSTEFDTRGNRRDNTPVLTEAKPRAGFVSGYDTMDLPVSFRDDPRKVLCAGPYELWWVQRTKSNYIVEKKMPFYVTQPQCDWDKWNKEYKLFHTLGDLTSQERYYCIKPTGVITREESLVGAGKGQKWLQWLASQGVPPGDKDYREIDCSKMDESITVAEALQTIAAAKEGG